MSIDSLIKVAAITGGHVYDVVNFHRFFRSMSEAEVFIHPLEDFLCSPPEVRRAYDVILFYNMHLTNPNVEILSKLGDAPQGIFMLHHSILAYPECTLWSDIVGIADRSFNYFDGQQIHVEIADTTHPITTGLTPWDMIDETYTMDEAGDDSHPLLTVNHPNSMKCIAWTRQFKKSRVFCLESGHDNLTWSNHNFREVVRRGLIWCAGRS